MAFEPGQPRPEGAGRKPGSINKKNQEIVDLARELNCDPARILMMIIIGDFEGLKVHPTEIDLDKRKEAAKELMPYLYGKRKPVDSDGSDKGDPLSDLINVIRERE
jgi:hypothetical protein